MTDIDPLVERLSKLQDKAIKGPWRVGRQAGCISAGRSQLIGQTRSTATCTVVESITLHFMQIKD